MNIAKLTEQYIEEHPVVADSLKMGLLNLSALSRKIIKECGLKYKDSTAIIAACRRHLRKVKSDKSLEHHITELLRDSHIDAHNKMTMAVIEKNIFLDDLFKIQKEIKAKGGLLHIVEGVNAIVVITSDDFFEQLKDRFKGKIIRIRKNLVQIIIKSPREIEITPGVISTISTRLFENGINMLEFSPCWTDTMIIIEEKDTAEVFRLLKY